MEGAEGEMGAGIMLQESQPVDWSVCLLTKISGLIFTFHASCSNQAGQNRAQEESCQTGCTEVGGSIPDIAADCEKESPSVICMDCVTEY